MSDNEWYTQVALVIGLVVVVAFVAGLGLGGSTGSQSGASPPTESSTPSYLYFTVTTSAATHYDTFYPANVSIPHGHPVVITITSYDPGVNNVTSPYTDVIGAVGGTANFTYGANGTPEVRSSLANGLISHTFTVTLPGLAGSVLLGAGKPMINVPVPVSPDGVIPVAVTFEVVFDHAGEFVWSCLAPCDPYSMQTPGFMIGSISVS
jgi:hypothetical protein